MKELETKSLSSYEQFCVPTEVDRVPARFLTMLSILRGVETHSEEEKRSLLASANLLFSKSSRTKDFTTRTLVIFS